MDENERTENSVEVEEERESKSSNAVLVFVIIAFVLLIGGVFLFQSRKTEPQKAMVEEQVNTQEASDGVVQEEEGDYEFIDLEAGSFYFEPNVIEVQEGQKVRLNINSVDAMHDFNIDELGVTSGTINGGDTLILEFTAGEAGDYEFYCSIGNHRSQGMVGTLRVLEADPAGTSEELIEVSGEEEIQVMQ